MDALIADAFTYHLVTKVLKTRVLLVSIVPPRNDCGVRIVMHRHLVERNPFELHVASNADFADDLLVHTPLHLPYPLWRLSKTRVGPQLASWVRDYENIVWPLTVNRALEEAVQKFQPEVILTLAECGLCHIARQTAQRHKLPLVGLFLDWFPTMKNHYGHKWTQGILSRRYRQLYAACDLAFCTSDGIQELLGPHPNSHVIYPIPGKHRVPGKSWPPSNGKFRLVYVGSVENFYGRMICSLIEKVDQTSDLEIIIVGPNADWPAEFLQRAKAKGVYLGFKPPEGAAPILAGADALLVLMSFESEHRLFMETSFTTKFLDYVSLGKPVIMWGPDYCAPVRVAQKHGGAVVVSEMEADSVVSACRQIVANPALRDDLSRQARHLHQTLFNPDRLQGMFVSEIERLIAPPQAPVNSVCLAVLNRNGVRHLQALLPTLETACRRSPIPASIMVLDNQSTEGDVEWTKQHHPNVRCAVAHKNDYLFSYNWLLAQLKEDVVVLLNNDLRVQPDFLTPLLRRFESTDVFAVSGRIYDWEGQNVMSGPAMLEYQHGFYSWRFHLDRQTRSHTLFSSGACMAVDRRKFLELGGFNRLFYPAYCEDLELCFRAWRRGWRCIYEPESIFYHREHASWSDSSFGRVNTLSLRNALLFQWSSLPMQRHRLERNARIANLIVRGLFSGDATWSKVWIGTILFWGKTRHRFRHLKTRETELKQVMQRIAALGWDNSSIKATHNESCCYRLSE